MFPSLANSSMNSIKIYSTYYKGGKKKKKAIPVTGFGGP
jgi:hypothetical protein